MLLPASNGGSPREINPLSRRILAYSDNINAVRKSGSWADFPLISIHLPIGRSIDLIAEDSLPGLLGKNPELSDLSVTSFSLQVILRCSIGISSLLRNCDRVFCNPLKYLRLVRT